MSQPAWEHIGVVQGGIIPVLYQQVKEPFGWNYKPAVLADFL
jgi:hypothetical protein